MCAANRENWETESSPGRANLKSSILLIVDAVGRTSKKPPRATARGFLSARRHLNKRRVKVSGYQPVIGPSAEGRDFDGEFDPGSGQTLAACIKHASRTVLSGTVADG